MTDFVNRRDVFIGPDGREYRSRQYARRATPRAVYAAAKEWLAVLKVDPRVTLQYMVGTAERESGFALNARAIEANGFVTDGLYQISKGERDHVAPGRNLFDLHDATEVMVRLAKRNLEWIDRALRDHVVGTVRKYNEDDVPAYLSIAHNQGLGAVRNTILAHGLDWAAYKARNATHPSGERWARYGDTVISGGSRWGEAIAL